MTTTDPTLTGDHAAETDGDSGAGTGTRATRILGIATVVSMGWLVAFGLGFSPEDRDQRESVRLLYVHVPTIWIAYLAFVVTAVASGIYFFGKTKSLGWDRLAGASAEITSTAESTCSPSPRSSRRPRRLSSRDICTTSVCSPNEINCTE